jgi:hypothetical protein
MDPHMVELDPPVSEIPSLIEERKRFDEERQQLRRELSTLKRQFHEHDQRLRIILEQEKAKLLQENLHLTSELFAVRRQLQSQSQGGELRKENEALRGRLLQLEQEVAQFREQSECDALVRELVVHDQVDEAIDEERQQSQRAAGNPIPVLLSPREEDSELLSGWIVERSLAGLTLLLDQELPAASVWRIKNARPSCTRPEWVTITIEACLPEGNSFKLHGKFLQHPTWQDMQQFW